MKRIDIPFLPRFEKPMFAGTKTATSRSKRYGYPGDWFEAFGRTFILTEVIKTKLYRIAHEFYAEEGFTSPKGFIDVWEHLHPRLRYNPSTYVYLHRFQLQSAMLPPFHTHVTKHNICEFCGIDPTPMSVR